MLIFEKKILREKYLILIPIPSLSYPHISLIPLSTLLLLSYTLIHSILSYKEDIVRLLRIELRSKD